MKKTLIALAAVAATGAAFAQSTVTLGGKLRFAYESAKTTSAGVDTKASGLRVTDGDFTLTAVEDLGAGLKATMHMAVQSRGRDTTVSGRDAYLKLDGGFGSVSIGSVDLGNGILGLGGAGAPVYGVDGTVIAAAVNADFLKYTTPALIPGLTLSASILDQSGNNATANTLGLGSTATTQDGTVLGVNYASGPLAVAADFTSYGENAATGTLWDDRTRISTSYDLGVAKLGFGYETRDTTANVTTKDMVLGVAVPMGAWTFGVNYATSKTDGSLKVKGWDLGVKYDLSKRTYVAFHYQTVDNITARLGSASSSTTFLGSTAPAIGATNENSKFRVQLSHAF